MSGEIDVELRGDRVLGVQLEKIPTKIRAKLVEVITKATEQIADRSRGAAPHKTGELASHISSRVFDEEKKIEGVVFLSGDFAKAAALEYGSAGRDFLVKGHFASLGHLFAEQLNSPLYVFIEEHMRLGGLGAYEFMRGPAAAMESEIIGDMREAVENGALG